MPKGLIAILPGGDAAALTSIATTPLLLHAVETMRRAGADEILVSAPRDAMRRIRDTVGGAAAAVRWLDSEADGPAEAIRAAAPMLEGERFLLHTGEGMVIGERGALAAALADPAADATVFFHAGGGQDAVLTGVHAFGPAIVDAIVELAALAQGPVRLADAIDHLAERGGVVRGGVLGWWRYGSSPEDLLDVNRRVLDQIESSVEALNLAGARIEGRVRIHPTATVRSSVVRGPAVIAAHARVTDAFVGPYSAIGAGAVIENAQVASSILLPRARIRHVGVRVEDSIVGPGASIGRDFGLPNAIRLLVGQDARVTFG